MRKIVASELYFKKLNSKHQELTVVESVLPQIIFTFVNVIGKHL